MGYSEGSIWSNIPYFVEDARSTWIIEEIDRLHDILDTFEDRGYYLAYPEKDILEEANYLVYSGNEIEDKMPLAFMTIPMDSVLGHPQIIMLPIQTYEAC